MFWVLRTCTCAFGAWRALPLLTGGQAGGDGVRCGHNDGQLQIVLRARVRPTGHRQGPNEGGK